MRRVLPLVVLVCVFTGCLSPVSQPEIRTWLVSCDAASLTKLPEKFALARLSQVTVRDPYASSQFAVLRGGGQVAFDYYNRFPISPALLLKNPSLEILRESGVFSGVVEASSSARTDVSIEIRVSKLALDFTKGASEPAYACVTLDVALLDSRDQRLIAAHEGVAEVAVEKDCYAMAFSTAYTKALLQTLTGL